MNLGKDGLVESEVAVVSQGRLLQLVVCGLAAVACQEWGTGTLIPSFEWDGMTHTEFFRLQGVATWGLNYGFLHTRVTLRHATEI